MKPIYLDYNATTPIDPAVAAAMLPFLYGVFGNPSSAHAFGAEARSAVEKARASVALLLGARPEEIVFTGGGSEANNLAIKGTAFARREQGNHIITTAIEHPAVLEVCDWLETRGFRVTRLPVDQEGFVDPAAVERAITTGTILVTVMLANNEVGTLEPVAEIAALCRKRGIVVHTDAAQAVGKIPVKTADLGVDLLSVAGHKLYAPKGIGALYVAPGVRLEKFIHGAPHEGGRRAGTENVLEIVGLGRACELAEANLAGYSARMASMRDRLEKGLEKGIPDIRFNGPRDRRLPNTASVSFRDLDAATILSGLEGVAASAGAACHADKVDLSHVLSALGVPLDFARGTVRFSVGRETTEEEIDSAILQITRVVHKLRPSPEDAAPEGGPAAGDAGEAGEIRLTRFTRGLGCACKLPAALLKQVTESLPPPRDPSSLVGAETSDDAAVYDLAAEFARLRGTAAGVAESLAVVQTVDFFTPVVDDPYDFGRVAAANSLSDIYAMGAVPRFALAVAGFPAARLPISVLKDMLRGAADTAALAGVDILGGHTVDVSEPLLGLAVTGFVRKGGIIRNRGGRPGDKLVLTKALGTGILSTALKQGLLDKGEEGVLIEHMCGLNRNAAEAMIAAGARAATDITGFGLLGHLLEMLGTDKGGPEIGGEPIGAVIRSAEVPLLARVREFAAAGIVPGGSKANFENVKGSVRFAAGVPEVLKAVLTDAQTSGGLLIAVPAEKCGTLLADLAGRGVAAAEIGEIISRSGPAVEVL
jgi:cysteine desulfurase NifS/selenium donor protein